MSKMLLPSRRSLDLVNRTIEILYMEHTFPSEYRILDTLAIYLMSTLLLISQGGTQS